MQRETCAWSWTVWALSYMGYGAIHWRPITRRKWQIQAYNPQLVRNSSSPKALGFAEVVYFVERHLKCRHSNRGDLKEQWSNHKGFPPWDTKDNMGAYQKWFFFPFSCFSLPLCLLFFFLPSLWSVKASYHQKTIYVVLLHRLCSLAEHLSVGHSTLNLQTM